MKKVIEWLKIEWWTYIIKNDYPYDMCRDKKVKTEHHTLFYNDIESNYISDRLSVYTKDWYTVQINSSDNQSILEIQHLHFIKIINEN